MEGFKDDGIVFGVDVLDDTKDAALDVDAAQLAIDGLEVGDVIADDALTRQHGGAGLAASAGEGAREVRAAAQGPVSAHEEHMLGEPAFFVGPLDGEPKGELLHAQAVARVLVVDGEDAVFLQVDVDAALVDIAGVAALVELAGRMQEVEEVGVVPFAFEGLIALAIEQIFGVSDVGAVGDLQGAQLEVAADGPEAEEAHQHLSALHGAVKEAEDFIEAFLAVGPVGLEAEVDGFIEEVLGVGLVSGLVLDAVEVDGVSRHREGELFFLFFGQLAHVVEVILAIGDDGDSLGLGQGNRLVDQFDDARVVERFEFTSVECVNSHGALLRCDRGYELGRA